MDVYCLDLTDEQKLILKGKVCPYCKESTELANSSEIYGREFGPIWICRKCNAYVGCHPGTTEALGRVTNSQLRKAKRQAHFYFDQIWKKKYFTRGDAYSWLSKQLELPKEYTHIGMFKIETCNKVAQVSYEFLNKMKHE